MIDEINKVEYNYKMTTWTEYTGIYEEYCIRSAELDEVEVTEAELPALEALAKKINHLPSTEFLQTVAYAIMQE